jgi:5-methyltetrahydropteroyltriglutamate--homocysteine methyltransferase
MSAVERRNMATASLEAAAAAITIRSDVVGSLLRPDYLKEARQRWESGDLSPVNFKRVEDRAVDEAVALQQAAGLDVLTDGEMRRYAFFGHLIEALDGFDREGGWAIPFRNEVGEEVVFKRPVVVEKLRWKRGMCTEEFAYLRARTERPKKVTLVSTQQAAAYYDPERSGGAYPTREAYLADVVDLTRREIAELIRLGCTYIQVDAPQYAALLDESIRAGYRQRGADVDRMIETSIELDNAVISGWPRHVTFGIHICRGNYRSMFYASGGYDPVAQRVFGRTGFHRFLLEYDDERSGTFEPLRFVPEDRVVVLGLVTTKKPRLETEDELAGRIEEAARVVPLERLALSPQCGFASTWEGNRIPEDIQRQKLELVARTAHRVWGA